MRLLLGDCLEVLPTLEAGSVDAVVTDPPYALVEPRSGGDGTGQAFAPRTDEAKALRRGGFMGKKWDAELPSVAHWQAALRVIKPGGYLLAFGGTRTFHRLACALEDAGWELRDTLCWLYGSGWPKGKGCLKPAWEPILLARKPGPCVLPLGIDECRVEFADDEDRRRVHEWPRPNTEGGENASPIYGKGKTTQVGKNGTGRYPANVCHDGSAEVLEAFAAFGEREGDRAGRTPRVANGYGANFMDDDWRGRDTETPGYADTGSAARFFFSAKASKADRGKGNGHPTVKPVALMRWLVKLVCPRGGTILDPFLGSGSTAVACHREGRECVGVEREESYLAIARRRLGAEREKFALFEREESA